VICAGIDVGSRMIKAVLWDSRALTILASGVADQGLDQEPRACGLLQMVMDKTGGT
jgi:activator of 2-hydroxyglutaryl-CoA dehydratase